MSSARTPFNRFTRLALLCLVALGCLGVLEWRWVRNATSAIAEVPERTVLVARQRMLASRLTSSTIFFMQAPTPEDRVPHATEWAQSKAELRSSQAQLRRYRLAANEGPTADAPLLRKAEQILQAIGTRADSLVTARVAGTRGPMSETEIQQSLQMRDSLFQAIDRVHAEELAWSSRRTAVLQRDQALVFVLIGVVCVAMVLLVLRPAAKDMEALSSRLQKTNEQLEKQTRQLEDSATEFETQNHELIHQQAAMEAHRTILEELQQAASAREARHRSVLESMADGMLLRRADGKLLAWNASAVRILGLNPDDLGDHTATDGLIAFEDEAGNRLTGEDLPIMTTLRSGTPLTGVTLCIRRPDGERRFLRANTRLVENTDDGVGSERSGVVTFVDVTEERQNAEMLRLFSVVVEQTDQAIAMSDDRLRLTWVNPAWTRTTGYTLDEAMGKRPGEILHGPHTAADTLERMRTAVRSGQSFEGEVLNYRKDGTPFWMEVHTTPLRDASGQISSWVSVQRDVTARKGVDRERQQLAAALAVTADGVGIVSVGGGLEFANHAYARAHGERPRNLTSRPWLQRFSEEEALRIEKDIIPVVTRLGAWSGEVTGHRADGSTFPQDLSITLLPTGGLVCVMRDSTERKSAEELLRTQAVRDELTQLLNRRGFFASATECLADAHRRRAPAVLLYGDADRFKQVNDTYGHDVGDRVLQTIASVLRSNLRASDVVARLGGDEFTALLVDTDDVYAESIIEKIQRALVEVDQLGVCPCPIGMSIGYAVYDPDEPFDLDAMLRIADIALYEKKRRRIAA